MITKLEILNGNLDINFNNYIYEYTVKINDNIDKLDFNYVLEDGVGINIRNNYLLNNNIVYVDVFNGEKIITYTFNTYKENTDTVMGINDYITSLEVEEANVNFITVDLLFTVMFFIIVFAYLLIFRKLKK